MSQKIVCQCDPSGYYLCQTVADESPLEPGVFHIPAGAVDCEPPAMEPGNRYRLEAGAWVAEPVPEPVPE